MFVTKLGLYGGISKQTKNGASHTWPKPLASWDYNDYNIARWNSQGLKAIQCYVTGEEFRKIFVCTISKQS